jgi:hypothetical protein
VRVVQPIIETNMEEKNKAGASPVEEQKTPADEVEDTTSSVAAQDKNESEEAEELVVTETSDDTVDYAKALEEEKRRRGQAEHTIVELKKRNKELEQEQGENEGLNEEAEELVERKVREHVDSFKKELVQDTIEDILISSSDNPDEQKLIRFHYENSIRPTGYSRQAILNDMRRAKMLANESKILKENDELRYSLKAKNSMSLPPLGVNQDKKKPDDTDKNFTEEQLKRLNRIAKGNPKKLEELKQKTLINRQANGAKVYRQ